MLPPDHTEQPVLPVQVPEEVPEEPTFDPDDNPTYWHGFMDYKNGEARDGEAMPANLENRALWFRGWDAAQAEWNAAPAEAASAAAPDDNIEAPTPQPLVDPDDMQAYNQEAADIEASSDAQAGSTVPESPEMRAYTLTHFTKMDTFPMRFGVDDEGQHRLAVVGYTFLRSEVGNVPMVTLVLTATFKNLKDEWDDAKVERNLTARLDQPGACITLTLPYKVRSPKKMRSLAQKVALRWVKRLPHYPATWYDNRHQGQLGERVTYHVHVVSTGRLSSSANVREAGVPKRGPMDGMIGGLLRAMFSPS